MTEHDHMRAWLLDCFDHDEDSVWEIEACTASQLERAVERYYDGGLVGFRIDGGATC